MNVKSLFIPFLLVVFFSCNTGSLPNTDIEVARAFIQHILDNNFKDAERLVLKEETNKEYFDLFKKDYESKSTDELEKYRQSDIIITEISPVSDSVSIISYSNSYKKDQSNKVKVVRINGQWLIDLKYTFSGNL